MGAFSYPFRDTLCSVLLLMVSVLLTSVFATAALTGNIAAAAIPSLALQFIAVGWVLALGVVLLYQFIRHHSGSRDSTLLVANDSYRNWVLVIALTQGLLLCCLWFRLSLLLPVTTVTGIMTLSTTGAVVALLVTLEASIWCRWKLSASKLSTNKSPNAVNNADVAPPATSAGIETDPAAASSHSTYLYQLVRPALFLFLFGIDLSMAFIPLHMESLPQQLAGIPVAILMGLPISVEFMAVAIAILWAGVWVDKQGWQRPFYLGMLLAIAGGIYSWLAVDAINFILSRALIGLGFGLVQLAAHGYVLSHTATPNKAQGMSHLAAGIYAGSLCGAATGAVLAEYLGYTPVFLLGSCAVLLAAIYSGLFLPGEGQYALKSSTTGGGRKQRSLAAALWLFLADYRVVLLTLFSSIPAAIAVIGFINYFVPVYLDASGVDESGIGQVLMLFGLCIALLAPRAGKLIDHHGAHAFWVVAGGVLGACSCLLFFVLEGVAACIAAVVMLGVANCFVLSAQNMYLLDLPITRILGVTTSLAIFRALSRIGQVLGPVVFGSLVALTDLQQGVGYLGLAYLLLLLCFTLMLLYSARSRQALEKSHVH